MIGHETATIGPVSNIRPRPSCVCVCQVTKRLVRIGYHAIVGETRKVGLLFARSR